MSRSALFVSPVQPIGGCSSDVYSWDKSSNVIRLIMSFLDRSAWHSSAPMSRISVFSNNLESTRQDITELAKLDVDSVQIQVLTPYPKTPQPEAIEAQYGLNEEDFSLYNSRNLVWNHPTVSGPTGNSRVRDGRYEAFVKCCSLIAPNGRPFEAFAACSGVPSRNRFRGPTGTNWTIRESRPEWAGPRMKSVSSCPWRPDDKASGRVGHSTRRT
jgi:hypothetical protein